MRARRFGTRLNKVMSRQRPAVWLLVSGLAAAGAPFVAQGQPLAQPQTGRQDTSPLTEGRKAMLIPRKLIFGNPERASPYVSPDGTKLAFLAPVDGVLNVWVGPLGDLAASRPVTEDKVRGIHIYFWGFTSEHILYLQDKGGDENWRVFCVDLASGQTRDLTPFEGVQARIQEVSPLFPDEILVAVNNRDARFHDIHRVNIRTGESRLVQKNQRGEDDGFVAFLTDENFRVRFALDMLPDGGQELLRPGPEGKDWSVFARIEHADTLTTSPVGFDRSGDTLYMLDSRGRDTAALTAIDVNTGQSRRLAEDPRADIDDTLSHPRERTVQAAASTYERKRWQVLDSSLESDFAYLQSLVDGELGIDSRSLDDRHWIVHYNVDNGPLRYYHYDRSRRKAEFLFSTRPALEKLALARMHALTLPSRDGQDLVCYLTLPVGSDPDGDGRPDGPLPMVLNVHGGPWARDRWGFDPDHQWLANRGYAVLSVNFRGSTGFGKRFVNAGDREWAGRMHEDLIHAVSWAIKQRIADPMKVAIMGGSYGGYATLVGLTFTPDVFACGVDIVGPSNLVTLLESIPPYWTPLVDLFTQRVGDHRTEDGRRFLLSRSPLTRVEQIRRPLLIGQGANDQRVKQAESDQIVAEMKKKGIPVTYVLYPDEGHGFVRPENRLSFFSVAEAFLAQHLGGEFEPIGDDLSGSSITVPEGAGHIPHLREALAQQ
jgi:dipeptidyl aminopeptidase/acylaminoacyl peptidase